MTLCADNAEFLAAVSVNGIPHAPGYPLYMLMGRMIKSLPGQDLTWKLNVFSALCSALSLTLLFRISLTLSNSFWVSLLSISLLAFSKLFWFSSIMTEVMALAVLMIAFLFSTFFSSRSLKHFYVSALILGLGFSHHHTILFLVPSFIIIWANAFFKQKWSLKNLLIAGALFICGLTPYLYLLYAAQSFPPINWGRPYDVESLINVFIRRMYGTLDFSATAGMEKLSFALTLELVVFYFKKLFWSFGLASFLLPIGIWLSWKQSRKWTLCILLPWFLIGPLFTVLTKAFVYRSAYTHLLIERHMVYSHWILALFFLFAAKKITMWFPKKSYVLYGVLISSLLITHASENILRKWDMADRFLDDVFQKFPPHALVIVHGDINLFGSWYYQYVKKQRKDLTILSLSLSGDLLHLYKQNPEIWPKPAGPLYEVFRRFIFDEVGKRRIFTLGLTANQLILLGVYNNPLFLKPFGYAVEVAMDIPSEEEVIKDSIAWDTIAPYAYKDASLLEKMIKDCYAIYYFNLAVSLKDMGYWDLAFKALDKSISLNGPSFLKTQDFLAQLLHEKPENHLANLGILSLKNGYFSSARKLFLRALELNHTHIMALHGLAETYSSEEYVRALNVYRKILSLYPADKIAIESIKRIQRVSD